MNLSEARKLDWKKPDYRKKQIINAKIRFTGRKFSIKHRKKISESLKGKKRSNSHCENLSSSIKSTFKNGREPHNKGKSKNNYIPLRKVSKKLSGKPKSDAHKKAMSESKKRLMKNPIRKRQFIKRLLISSQRSPNGAELKFMKICSGLPIKYVGDGSLIIGFKNPDFLVIGQNKLIEIFGRFFHDRNLNPELPYHRTEFSTKKIYKKHGYKCLIVRSDKLCNETEVRTQVERFIGDRR